MSTAREEILRRIRVANANAGVTWSESRPVDATPDGGRVRTPSAADVVEMFVERTEDYKAVVETVPAADVPARVAAAIAQAQGVLLPEGLPREVVDAVEDIDASLVRDDPGTASGLDAIEAVVTTCAAAVAETGTIVLDHTAGQGRRALTLVPDLHVCIVRADQIHADVPSVVRALRPSVEAGQPLTWISGPSATSDIELDRVEGVHGPRRLHVIVVSWRQSGLTDRGNAPAPPSAPAS